MSSKAIYEKLFIELASETRYDILRKLYEKSLKQTQISNNLDLTIQETHRQITRLIGAGLIQKNHDGTLSLSEYGKIISKQLNNYQIISKFGKHFENHLLDDLPQKSIQTIGCMINCEIIQSMTAVVEICKSILTEAEKYLKVISAQSPQIFDGILDEKLENGFKIGYIYGKNTIISKSAPEITDKNKVRDLISKGVIERKMLDRVGISLLITDKHAALMLPDLKGEMHMNFMILGEDELFRNWCLDLFNYKWNNAYEFDNSKLNPV